TGWTTGGRPRLRPARRAADSPKGTRNDRGLEPTRPDVCQGSEKVVEGDFELPIPAARRVPRPADELLVVDLDGGAFVEDELECAQVGAQSFFHLLPATLPCSGRDDVLQAVRDLAHFLRLPVRVPPHIDPDGASAGRFDGPLRTSHVRNKLS